MAILNAHGVPEVPGDVLRRLRATDPRMGMVFLPLMDQFAVTRDWLDTDPRRAAAQRGDFDPSKCYDVVTYLPVDCTPDQAAAFVERGFRRSMGAEEIDRMVDEVQRESEANQDALLDKATEKVMDDVDSIVGRRLTGTVSNLDTRPVTRRQKKSKGGA